jgi:hypothetical protein
MQAAKQDAPYSWSVRRQDALRPFDDFLQHISILAISVLASI